MDLEYILLMPLFIISAAALIVVFTDAVWKNKQLNFWITLVSFIAVAGSAAYNMSIPMESIRAMIPNEMLTRGQVAFGGMPSFFDILFCMAAILALIASKPFFIRQYKELNEFYSLLLLSVSGMMYIAHSGSFLTLFLGIELMSITFYVLAGFIRTSGRSVEASLKYFLLGCFATGFLIYGIALIYGATGSMIFRDISAKLATGNYSSLYFSIGIGLIIVGLGFKSAVVPFHQWAADVYSGSPSVVSGFISTAGKAAALIAFIIIAKNLFPIYVAAIPNSGTFRLIIAFISAATMIIGNVTALMQNNVKRMLAFSSIAHAGYLLMGIAANTADGWNGIAFYSAAYILMQTGAFVLLSMLESNNDTELTYQDFGGLGRSHPVIAACMAVFMFSLAGIPPFAGFAGKYMLFVAAIKSGFTWLAIIAVIATLISLYFYIGLIIQMYFREGQEKPPIIKVRQEIATIILSVAGVIILGIFPNIILNLMEMF
jgi:NADH-quinone oxidoreductase subunit N